MPITAGSRRTTRSRFPVSKTRSTFLSKIDAGQQVGYEPATGRHAWLQVLRGSVSLNSDDLQTSDGAAVTEENLLTIQATSDAEIMLFDLA